MDKIANQRAKDLISDSDVTQKKLAKLFGVTEAMMSNYLTGKNDIPAWIVAKIAEYFHVTTDYLLGLTDVKEQQLVLSAGEKQIIEGFRTLSRDQRDLIAQNIRIMREQNQK